MSEQQTNDADSSTYSVTPLPDESLLVVPLKNHLSELNRGEKRLWLQCHDIFLKYFIDSKLDDSLLYQKSRVVSQLEDHQIDTTSMHVNSLIELTSQFEPKIIISVAKQILEEFRPETNDAMNLMSAVRNKLSPPFNYNNAIMPVTEHGAKRLFLLRLIEKLESSSSPTPPPAT